MKLEIPGAVRRATRRLPLLLVLFLPAIAAAAGPDVTAKILPPAAVAAGGRGTIAVEMTLGPGWHVNGHAPTESWLIPTNLELSASAGKLSEIRYPAQVTKSFAFAEKPMAVYDGTARFEADLDLPAGTTSAVTLRGTLSYQACNDKQCFAPAKIALEGTVPVGASGGATPASAASPAENRPAAGPIAGGAPPQQVYRVLGVPTLVFLGADGREVDSARLAGFEKPADFARRLDSVTAGGNDATGSDSDIGKLVGRKGLLLAFLAIFLGGLALNLTPCVYPVIPITVGYFAMQAEGNHGDERARRRRTLGLALLYLLGMALTYSVLGVAAALSGGLFGAALQSPWAVGTICLVLVALSLSMFGFYEIQAPQAILRKAGSKSGYAGALVMGTLVGFVAAPCIGPFVLGLLTYVATTRSALLGFSMFFVLALGLGLPYVFLALSSASLPRAGAWMIGVKHVFGVLMLAAAGWFGKSLPVVSRWKGGFWLPAAILVVGGLWLALFEKEGRDRPGFRAVLVACGVVFLGAGLFLLRPEPKGEDLAWQDYSPAAVAKAAADGKPVVIDFFADWCIPCKELEHRTFTDPEVARRLRGFVRLKVNLTNAEVGTSPTS